MVTVCPVEESAQGLRIGRNPRVSNPDRARRVSVFVFVARPPIGKSLRSQGLRRRKPWHHPVKWDLRARSIAASRSGQAIHGLPKRLALAPWWLLHGLTVHPGYRPFIVGTPEDLGIGTKFPLASPRKKRNGRLMVLTSRTVLYTCHASVKGLQWTTRARHLRITKTLEGKPVESR